MPFRIPSRAVVLVAIVLSVLAFGTRHAVAQGADTRFVRVGAPSGGNGASWATAYGDLKAALAAAGGNPAITKIWVAEGAYFPGATRFALRNNLAIYGGFAGTESALAQRDIDSHETILTGQGAVGIIDGGATNTTAVVDGFTIRDGAATLENGGAVLGGGSTFRNCRFINNSAASSGGAWFGSSGAPRFIACEFIGNSCGAGGAAIETLGASILVVGCRFTENTGPFACIYATTGPVTIVDSLLAGNGAAGVLTGPGPVTARNSTIVANSGQFLGQTAIRSGGTTTIQNSVIWQNDIVGAFEATYSLLPAPAPGTGNISVDPRFRDPAAGDWRLSPISPAIDAGSNALLPADSSDLDSDGDVTEPLPLDLAGVRRRAEEPSVPDTGVGPAPIVDIGAYEFVRDCNGNGIDDQVDIADGTSTDTDKNGIPDECEDCNGNGIPDGNDLASGTSVDCQPDGVPDECQLGPGPVVVSSVDDGGAEQSIGNNGLGNFLWLNAFQVEEGGEILHGVDVAFGSGVSAGQPATLHVWSDPTNDGNPADAVRRISVPIAATAPGGDGFLSVAVPDFLLGAAGTWFYVGLQTVDTPFPAPIDQSLVSAGRSWVSAATKLENADPDDLDAAGVFGLIDSYGFAGNWLIRARSSRELDCDSNGIPDACDIAGGAAADCNANGIPDACEPAGTDCDSDGVPDDCEIASGSAADCQPNGIPDACEIEQGAQADADGNGVPDRCEDCNANRVPDGTDIAGGASLDCQPDRVPDECQLNGDIPLLYAYDDAMPEFWVSSDAPNMAWLNGFTVDEGKDRLIAVDVMFGLVPEGMPHTVCLWSDPNGDGNPADAQVLASVETVAVNVGLAFAYTRIDIPDIDLPPGAGFFVGAITEIAVVGKQIPAPKDTTPPNGRSWLVGSFAAIDRNDLSNGADEFLRIDDLGGPFIGNWSVRAVALSTLDCNDNDIPDDCDIANGTSTDANGDGLPDECGPCLADLDLDGMVNAADLTALLLKWGPCATACTGDLDGDGRVDAADLSRLLVAWGPCGP